MGERWSWSRRERDGAGGREMELEGERWSWRERDVVVFLQCETTSEVLEKGRATL